MAEEDGVARSELRVAAMLVERHSLSPPVDVFALATEYAQVERVSIPTGQDGLYLDRRSRGPLIVVNRSRGLERQRFTLAHELGHCVIPWHVGDQLACTIQGGSISTSSAFSQESEANRFAAALLLPPAWLASGGSSAPEDLWQLAKVARMSDPATVIALAASAPSGELIQLLKGERLIIEAPSEKTRAKDLLDHRADVQTSEFSIGARRIRWLKFSPRLSYTSRITEPSKELLGRILAESVADVDEAEKTRRSIVGVVSGSREHNCFSSERLFGILVRLTNRHKAKWPPGVSRHPLWARYLSRRADELIEGWTAKLEAPQDGASRAR